jgi:acyl-CoA synthetase (AMP-forming)/AMP-acid ligase II
MVGISVSIRDDNRDLPAGEIGTIWVKGKNVMLGYYNAPEATQEVLQDGWFNTGDLGYLDYAGRLVIAGREKDLIIHNGMKIYPQEVESLLVQHPNVLMAAVIGIKSGKTEIPVAFIVPHKPMENLEKELKKHCQQLLASYKIPQIFYLRDKLPQTATGKIDKKVLRSEVAREILE